jgi:hypothetical protein
MKKLFIILTILCISSLAFARDINRITVPAAASSAAVSGACLFYGITVITDGTNNVTLNIYDNTAASGTRLIPTNFIIPGIDRYFGYKPPLPIRCTNGIYVSVSVAGGGTCSYQVLYDRG